MPRIQTLNIAEAANLIETSSIVKEMQVSGMHVTCLKTPDSEVILVQGGDEFLLFS